VIVPVRGWRRLVLAFLAACGGATRTPPAQPPRAPSLADQVRVVTVTAQPAIVTTVRAAPDRLAGALGAAIFGLVARATAQELELAGPPFARYLERGPELVVEAGLPVVKPPADGAGELPAGPAATVVFVGPHEALGRAHDALDAWMAAHHRAAGGPRWEVYLTNPMTTPDPAAQRTQVFAPLAP
jgi:hypothetical protein